MNDPDGWSYRDDQTTAPWQVTTSEYNYTSHKWKGYRTDVPGQPTEYDRACEDCGCADLGDPGEFPDLQYPHCDEMGD